MNTPNTNEISTELSNLLDSKRIPFGSSKIIIDFVSEYLKTDQITEKNDSLSNSKAKMTNISGNYQTRTDIIANKAFKLLA